jgi:hypothetical protein
VLASIFVRTVTAAVAGLYVKKFVWASTFPIPGRHPNGLGPDLQLTPSTGTDCQITMLEIRSGSRKYNIVESEIAKSVDK